jgi:hypothetical protein
MPKNSGSIQITDTIFFIKYSSFVKIGLVIQAAGTNGKTAGELKFHGC